jgi:plastocyanin
MPSIMVQLFVDGSPYPMVAADQNGKWGVQVTLSDGDHELWAVAHYQTMISPESRHVKVTVDTTLSWSPISLHFTAQTGHVLWPRGPDGRMDETGWRVALRAGQTYTASVYACCATPTVTLQIDGGPVLPLTDPDGDGWHEGSFTAPTPLSGLLTLCVTCGQIQRCSDGTILIDPEGTVYDLNTGTEVAEATVTCLEQQSSGSGTTYTPWPADAYGQENPQTTGADGYYSFYTPAGTYRVGVTKDGYQAHLSDDLLVVDEPVHYDVYLAPSITATADYTVAITALGFDPPILSVPPGSVIAWVNVDGDYHATTSVTPTMSSSGVASTAVGDPWDSGLLETGEVYVHQLTEGGTYTYQDGEDGEFTGHILVETKIYLPVVFRQYTAP